MIYNVQDLIKQSIRQSKQFKELIDTKTGDNINAPTFLATVKDFLEKSKDIYQRKEIDVGRLLQQAPIFKPSMKPNIYQMLVLKYIKQLPFRHQLPQLNMLQQKAPFLLVDPFLRKMISPIQYGYADLYRFLGLGLAHSKNYVKSRYPPDRIPTLIPDPKNNEYLIKEKRPLDTNPLYTPVSYAYTIPDAFGNGRFMDLMKLSPINVYAKLSDMYKTASNYYIDKKGAFSGGSKKEKGDKYISATYKDMLELIKYLIEREYDPEYIMKYMLKEKRPMFNYMNNNLDVLLYQMLLSHKVYTFKEPSKNDRVKISSGVFEQYKRNAKRQ